MLLQKTELCEYVSIYSRCDFKLGRSYYIVKAKGSSAAFYLFCVYAASTTMFKDVHCTRGFSFCLSFLVLPICDTVYETHVSA